MMESFKRPQLKQEIIDKIVALGAHERSDLGRLLMDSGGYLKVHPLTLYRWAKVNHPTLTLPYNITVLRKFFSLPDDLEIVETTNITEAHEIE